MKYVFDIDGTICYKDDDQDYEQSMPYEHRIEFINRLYDDGNEIVFFTARGMGRHNNNAALAIQEFYSLTENQLNSWGVKYHQLILGKPSGDLYVDDKGISDGHFFTNEICS